MANKRQQWLFLVRADNEMNQKADKLLHPVATTHNSNNCLNVTSFCLKKKIQELHNPYQKMYIPTVLIFFVFQFAYSLKFKKSLWL